MAIRQAVAANTNITFKILFNDAVAMTGGQPVDGPISVERIAHSVRAEGIERIALVSDEPQLFAARDLPAGTTIHHRRELDAVQRQLREIPGVTILIYAQTCATEKRRRRKRGLLEDPKKFVVINDLVCEGCGDCSVESNCLSVVPEETPFGRKRKIDQNTCNKDFSCVNGFCPSFVTVEGGERRQSAGIDAGSAYEELLASLPSPVSRPIDGCYDLLVTGVGGTGVVTVGQLITMAAHLEAKGASVLDFTGFAQKFGTVLSYIRLAESPATINQVRIEQARADALIACDLVVSSSTRASATYEPGHTRAVVNTAEMLTGDFVRDRDADLHASERLAAIRDLVGTQNFASIDANHIAEKLMGNTIYANVLLLGFAWQAGLVPVSLAALLRAIELNDVAVDRNKQAFGWGRIAAVNLGRVVDLVDGAEAAAGSESFDDAVKRRAEFLVAYQDDQLAKRYTSLLARVQAEAAGLDTDGELAMAVARSYFKLLSYKDEYEVARLHTATGFLETIRQDFGSQAKIRFHLAPPLLNRQRDARGRPRKREFGGWMIPVFRVLARLRGLRGSAFDVFGYTAERRMERALIAEFEASVEALLAGLTRDNVPAAVDLVRCYMDIRGYGPVKELAATRVRADVAKRLAEQFTLCRQGTE
jgi:indolepyruvate ferredoxin oxidoreductase